MFRRAASRAPDVEQLAERLDALGARIDEIHGGLQALRVAFDDRVWPALRTLVDDDAGHRRRLNAARDEPAYERPFAEPEPLVSITVPTRDRVELLTERSLPSLLAQTYERLEIIVVGDNAPPELAEAVRGIGDPRVSFVNLTQRVAVRAEPWRQHHISSTMARNEGQRRSSGVWLMQFDDDDALRPDAVGSLLACARDERAEVAYGAFEQRTPDGTVQRSQAFPPQWGSFGFSGAIVHSSLRVFERELVAADLDVPGDMYMLRRMVRAGVRFALLDAVVFDYFPARHREDAVPDAVLADPWPHSEIGSAP
jgi:glycosyltransferase involved in cell wall biosynthesis